MSAQICLKWMSSIIQPRIANMHTSCIVEAARKGTRMKREAKKRAMKLKKVEVAKKEFIPKKKRIELQ